MSKISDLIAKLCPNGVEYKKLGEVAEICRGVRVVRKELSETGKYEVFQNSLKPLGRYDSFNVKGKTAFVIGAGAAGEIGYSENDFWAADDCYYIDGGEKLMGRFAYYCLTSRQDWLASKVRKASIPRLARDFVKALVVPVPPLEVQREVVEVLDKFALLTAELEKRKKQYEHYRGTLLSGNWPRVKLGEACEMKTGGDVPESCVKGQLLPSSDHPYPVYSNGIDDKALYGYAADYRIEQESVTISARGTIGYHCWRPGKYTGIVRLITLVPQKRMMSKFLDYALSTVEFKSAGGGIPQLTIPMVRDYSIPLPPLAEQERIVKILDRFDQLCNDLTSGLPAEIAARKKQYEYYRDKLLNFKRAA